MRDFDKDELLGIQAVALFKKYLDGINKGYVDASVQQQKDGIDLIVEGIEVEIKHQRYEGHIVVEEASIGGRGTGWVYTSKAKYLVEVYDNKHITKIDMLQLRKWITTGGRNYPLYYNDKTNGNRGDIWQSSFKMIPLKALSGYVAVKEIILESK